MKEYEIHISASYMTSGGSKEWNCFIEYVFAKTAAEAKRIKRQELKEDGYRNISMEAIKV